MKKLIYQVYLGSNLNLYDFCTSSVARYCKKYDIDHIIQREPILKIVPDKSVTNRSPQSYGRLGYLPIYEKENAFSYLDQYDRIAIIDSDIYIRENAPDIFEELNDGTEFAAVVEREMPLTPNYRRKIVSYSREQYEPLNDIDWKRNESGHEFMNMGLMIFSKDIQKYLHGQTPTEFIRRQEFKRFVDGLNFWKWSTDQTLLNYWIRKEKMNVKRLDWRWNTLYKGVEDKYLKDGHFIHFFLKDHLPNKGENIDQLKRDIGA
jgi:hypothetical protein